MRPAVNGGVMKPPAVGREQAMAVMDRPVVTDGHNFVLMAALVGAFGWLPLIPRGFGMVVKPWCLLDGPQARPELEGSVGGGGGLGPKNLCSKKGPIRFSQR